MGSCKSFTQFERLRVHNKVFPRNPQPNLERVSESRIKLKQEKQPKSNQFGLCILLGTCLMTTIHNGTVLQMANDRESIHFRHWTTPLVQQLIVWTLQGIDNKTQSLFYQDFLKNVLETVVYLSSSLNYNFSAPLDSWLFSDCLTAL